MSERRSAAAMARFYAPSMCSMLSIIFVYFINMCCQSIEVRGNDPFELDV